MKHYGMTTKKFIKNTVCLLVSALVLIAATLAWFASGNQAEVSEIGSPMAVAMFTVYYYKAPVTDVFTYDPEEGALDTMTVDEREALSWQSVSAIDVEPLYPGEYQTYKIQVHVNEQSTPTLSLKNITCIYPEDATVAYDSLFLYATAVKAGTVIGTASGSFSDLMTTDEGALEIAPLSLGTQEAGSDITVYMDIGIPGYDVNGTHGELRLTGADVRIASVGVLG